MAKKQESKLPILPLGDRILVDLVYEEKSKGGLDLPTKKVNRGRVVAIGHCVPREFVDRSAWDLEEGDKEVSKHTASRGMRVGDIVFLPRGDKAGDKFEVEEEGKKYLLVPVAYVGGIFPS
jgi:co-chaperonin GroES (HSP10)